MTHVPSSDSPAAQYSLETRLARAALSGEPLEALLCALEGTEWALTLPGEEALYDLLSQLPGTAPLFADARLPIHRAALEARGLSVQDLEGDWRGARAVWLIEPDERALARANKAGVPLLVEASLSPGGNWPAQGAQYVTFLQGGALTGHAEPPLAALLGSGEQPGGDHARLSDLNRALALRDLAALPARLGRQGRSASTLADALGNRAEALAGSTLLLREPPPQGVSRVAALGGVVTAVRQVQAGWLLSVGLERGEELLALFSGAGLGAASEAPEPTAEVGEVESEAGRVAETAPGTPETLASAPSQTDEPLLPDLPPAEAGDPTADLSEAQHASYMRLREWRNAEAKRQDVSRFIVASNATLAEVARRAPRSLQELGAIKGLGPQRLSRYGDKLLELGQS